MDLVQEALKVKSLSAHCNGHRLAPVPGLFDHGKTVVRNHVLDPWLKYLLDQAGMDAMHPGWRAMTDKEIGEAIATILEPQVMATDIVQTAANIQAVNPSTTTGGTSNAAVTAGNSSAQDASGNWGPASGGSTAILSGTTGIAVALNSTPGTAQPLFLWKSGTINLGATIVKGTVYVVSKNGAGAISPDADLGSGNFVTVLGVGITTAGVLASPPGGCQASGVSI